MSDLFPLRSAVDPAARAFVDVVKAVPATTLDAPTPCADFAVRDLVNHLLYWLPLLRAAVRRQPPATGGERDAELVTPEWQADLCAEAESLAEALRSPSAWEGTAVFGAELPAHQLGAMVVTEFVLHGWDLAVATGVDFRCGDAEARAVELAVREFAPRGRSHGIFGPEVSVSDNGVPLERALGLSGRDPAWSR